MGLDFRNPRKFSRLITEGFEKACLDPDTDIIIFYSSSESELRGLMYQFKWFKWCINQEPDAAPEFTSLHREFKVTSRLKPSEVSAHQYLLFRAQPRRVETLLSLNPHLSDVLIPFVNP